MLEIKEWVAQWAESSQNKAAWTGCVPFLQLYNRRKNDREPSLGRQQGGPVGRLEAAS